MDVSGFEDLMNNNEKLRGEKEELRAALSQLEEEVWQFRQKEVSRVRWYKTWSYSSKRNLNDIPAESQARSHVILSFPSRFSRRSGRTLNAHYAMPRRNWRRCAATSNRRNAREDANNSTHTPPTRKSSRSSTTNTWEPRASERPSYIKNATFCFCWVRKLI